MDNYLIGIVLSLLAGSISIYGLFTQVFVNEQRKSSYALSLYSLLFFNITVSLMLGYMFLRYFPLPLLGIVIPQVILSYILTYQYYSYTARVHEQTKILIILGSLCCFIMVLLFIGMLFSQLELIGDFFGWIAFLIGTIVKIPQIVHNYLRKSLEGYSYHYLLSNFFLSIVALISSLLLRLPIQSILINLRHIAFYSIELGQYFSYKKT